MARLRVWISKAWDLVEEMNRNWRVPVVEKAPGGRKGGVSRLTPYGKVVLEAYRAMERSVERARDRALRRFLRAVQPG